MRTFRKAWGIAWVVTALLGNTGWSAKIVYPWRATTAIVKTNETFEVWFDADSGQTVTSVELQGPYNTVSTSISQTSGSWVYDQWSGNTYNRKIMVTVPSNAPADRYDLILKTSSGDVTSLAAVNVIKEYRSKFYIFHMSDMHRWQGTAPTYDTEGIILREQTAMVEIANILNPAMVIETGDNHYPNAGVMTGTNIKSTESRANQFMNGDETYLGMNDFFAPVFTVPGNHCTPQKNYAAEPGYDSNDLDGAWLATPTQYWNDFYGLQCHNFKYGDVRFVGVNNAWCPDTGGGDAGYVPNYKWQLDAAVDWLAAVGTGTVTVTYQHVPQESIPPVYKALEAGAGVVPTVMLAGHIHRISSNPFIQWNTKIYCTLTCRDGGAKVPFNLYEVDAAAGTVTAVGNPSAAQEGLETRQDYSTSKLKLTYSLANDGTEPANTATITNKFEFPIEGARVRFVMPKGKTYAITSGTIQQAFDGTAFHIVDVTVDVAANSTTEVSIDEAGIFANHAQFVSQSAPSTLAPGQTSEVSITMKNIGTDAWSTAAGHQLSSQPEGTTIWGLSRVALPHGVAPDQSVTFTFDITAPAERGTYDFCWRMLDDLAPNQGAFGGASSLIPIHVVGANDIHVEAEDFAANSGFSTQTTSDTGGGFNLAQTDAGDYVTYSVNVTHSGVHTLRSRIASLSTGARFDFKDGSNVLGSVSSPATGGWQTWMTVTNTMNLTAGTKTFTILATAAGWNLNWFELIPEDGDFDLVPVVTGLSLTAARSSIEGAGFVVGAVTQESSTVIPKGSVISQSPEGATYLAPGGTVNLVVSSGAPSVGAVLLAIDFHVGATDLLPVTPDYFVGWALGETLAGVAAPSTVINGYTVTLGTGSSAACLTTPSLQTGYNSRNRASYILNAGAFTQANMMRERIASLVNPTDPATGNGIGNGIYLKVAGLTPNTAYSIRAWGVDSTGTNPNATLKNGYNYGFNATAETAGLTLLGSYTVSGSPASIADNNQYSIVGEITSDATGTIIYKQIANIDKSVINGFVLSEVYQPPASGYTTWAVENHITGGPTDDDDDDGLSNLAEYAVGEKPALVRRDASLEFAYQRRNDDTSLLYEIQTTTNLLSGSWVPLSASAETNSPGGVYDTVIYTIPAEAPHSYIRLKITNN